MLQQLLIAATRVKASNASENLLNDKSFVIWIEKKKLLKKYITI